jgi:hypothetical protein
MLRSAHSVFTSFVWMSEQTAIVSIDSINWFLYNGDGECLLRGTSWNFECKPILFSSVQS